MSDPEKDYYKPIKTDSTFTMNYIQYQSLGDEDKNLSVKEYVDIIRPYLSNVVNNHKTQEEWKIHSGNTITENRILKLKIE